MLGKKIEYEFVLYNVLCDYFVKMYEKVHSLNDIVINSSLDI
jgi:hypothetical protein